MSKIQQAQVGVMGQLATKNIIDDLGFAIENDFDWFEIALDWPQNFNLPNDKIKEIRQKASDNNIKLIVHTAFYLPTSTLLPEIKKGLFKNVSKAIDLANKVGSDRLTIHPGWREMPSVAEEKSYDSLIENLKQIVKFGKEKNVAICLENLDAWGRNLCSSYDDFLKVLTAVPEIKVTLDIGHTNTADKTPVEFFRAVSDRVLDIHIHDNDGSKDQHKCIGEGNIDYQKVFKTCKDAGYYGPFILELFPYENLKKGQKEFVKIWDKV